MGGPTWELFSCAIGNPNDFSALYPSERLAPSLNDSLPGTQITPFERGSEMKRILVAVMAVAFVISVAGFAVAAEKAAAPAAEKAATSAEKAATSAEKAATSAEKSAASAKKSAKAAKSYLLTGTIETLDPAAGTFTVKGRKGNVDLKAGEKVRLGDFKVGDKVVVKHADGTASSVKPVKAAKAAKKAAAQAEKSADAAEKSSDAAAKSAADAKKAAPAPAAAPVKK